MKKNKRIRRNKLPQIKKDIKDFLLKEEGKIKKKDIAKLGISVALLGLVLDPKKNAYADHTNTYDSANHTSVFNNPVANSHNSSCPHISVHANHGSCGGASW